MVPAELCITTRAGRPTLFLEVVYDGTQPPKALFDDLRMIGFDPPTEMPPPSSAMDWSRPDPRTGRPYRVRSHRIQAQIEPPSGTGPKRSWTDDERRAYQTSLDGVLRRHGIDGWQLSAWVPIPAPDGAPTAPGAGVAPAAVLDLDTDDVVGFAAPTSSADLDAEADVETPRSAAGEVAVSVPDAPPPPGDEGAGGAEWHHVVITTLTTEPSDVLRTVQGAGMAARLTRVEREVVQRFRGSEQITRRAVPAVEMIVDRGQRLVIDATLEASGIAISDLTVETSPATSADLTAFLAGGAHVPETSTPATEAPAGHPTLATITAIIEPRRRTMIEQALDDADVTRHRATSASRTVTSHFRGSEHQTTAPAVRIEALVGPGAVGPIVALLTRLAGLDASDESQLRVVPPTGGEVDLTEPGAEPGIGVVDEEAAAGKPGKKRSRLRLVG